MTSASGSIDRADQNSIDRHRDGARAMSTRDAAIPTAMCPRLAIAYRRPLRFIAAVHCGNCDRIIVTLSD
jgi:hypothetical protein